MNRIISVKQFYLTHKYDPNRCYHSGSVWTWKWWQWRGTPHYPKFQHCRSLVIRLLNVISRTLVEGSYRSEEMQLVYYIAQVDLTGRNRWKLFLTNCSHYKVTFIFNNYRHRKMKSASRVHFMQNPLGKAWIHLLSP